jgi:hypothetical protein
MGLVVSAAAMCRAADAGPVLVVPHSAAVMHLNVDLPKGFDTASSDALRLVELGGTGGTLEAQVVASVAADGTLGQKRGRLVVDIPPVADVPAKTAAKAAAKPPAVRRFRLETAGAKRSRSEASPSKGFSFSDVDAKSLKLTEGDKPVLVYNHGTITNEKVPAKDVRRSRACYIHPLWGLGGEVLTDDFPADHYHHHGVFWTWPHVGIGGKDYDLWMNRGIRPEFVRWLHRDAGPVAAVLGVENGWFIGDKKVMIERVWLRVGKACGPERPLDLEFVWTPVDQPITLRGAEGKSYGGLTVRFAVKNPKDSTITVPRGSAAADLPDTPLPWADLSAKFNAKSPSGAAIFVPREHPDYPPTWLTRHYGAQCVGWPGVQGKTFEAGKPIHLQYRLWIHDSAVNVKQLEQAYEAYNAKAVWEK